jgi:hypothetical protein
MNRIFRIVAVVAVVFLVAWCSSEMDTRAPKTFSTGT